MTNISFEIDEEWLKINFGQFSVFFRIENEGLETKNRIDNIIDTIEDFLDNLCNVGLKKENPYYLIYNGTPISEINLCLLEDWDIGMQYSNDSVEYFCNLTTKDLLDIVNRLRIFKKTFNF